MRNYQSTSFKRNFLIKVGAALAVVFGAVFQFAPGTLAQNAKQPDELARHYQALADSLYRISEHYYYHGRLDEAWELLETASPIIKRKEISGPAAVKLQIQRAKILYYKNSLAGSGYSDSIALLMEAKKAADASGSEQLKATAADLVGLALYSQAFTEGDLETPHKYFREALEIRKKIDDRQGVSETLFHLGLIYENKNNPTKEDKEKAFEYYRQALEVAEKGGFKLESSYAYRHLAGLYQERGDLEKAIDYFTRSFALREEIGFRIYLSPAALTLGDVYLEKKDYAKALEFYKKGLTLAEEVGGKRFIVRALLQLGATEQAAGRADNALGYFRQALKSAEDAKNTEGAKAAAERIAKLSKTENKR